MLSMNPRMYRIVASGTSGKVTKKITAVLDTARIVENPISINPAKRKSSGPIPTATDRCGSRPRPYGEVCDSSADVPTSESTRILPRARLRRSTPWWRTG